MPGKQIFTWHEEYGIDGDIIDREHKKLIGLANQVLSIDRARDHEEEIEEIVREFYRYVDYHFNHEQQFMEEAAYPNLPDHMDKHEQIINEMNQYMTRSGNMTQLLSQFRQLAYKWVVIHILNEDLKFRDYLREKNEHTEASAAD